MKHAGLDLRRLRVGEEKGTKPWGLAYATKKLIIDLTSPKGKKMIVKFEPAKPAALKVATTIDETIVYRKGSVLP